jgi:hypothetical protein
MTRAERALFKKLLPRLRARFEEDFYRSFVVPLKALSPADRAAAIDRIGYMLAKQRAAQNRDFAPLLKAQARRFGDAQLAELAKTLPPVPWSKSKARADLIRYKRALAQHVRDIRKMIKEEEPGMARVPRRPTVALSAELLECKPGEVEKLIDGK